MKILVVGSGLIGVSTAWFLRRQGHEVTVLDRAEGASREGSFANGALLTPSMSEPWNSPGVWRTMLASLARSDSPMQLRLRGLKGAVGWGIRFLSNSRVAAFERNTESNLQLALYSLQTLHDLLREQPIDYSGRRSGSLRIFRDAAALERACAGASAAAEQLPFRKLSREETIALEPALAPIGAALAGALYYEIDEIGDAYRFSVALAELARQRGVQFHFGVDVQRLEERNGRVTAVITQQQRFTADRYVVAAGSYVAPLLQRLDIQIPIRPVKGYSLTYERPPQLAFQTPVIDDELHAVVVPVGNVIRVAGTAEVSGYNLDLPPARINNLRLLVSRVLPDAGLTHTAGAPWCGLRPVSADGVPVIGAAPIENLWINAGHGHLGWTMAPGSGRLLAELIQGISPSIDPARYALKRFAH